MILTVITDWTALEFGTERRVVNLRGQPQDEAKRKMDLFITAAQGLGWVVEDRRDLIPPPDLEEPAAAKGSFWWER